jgi:hypothetical protein
MDLNVKIDPAKLKLLPRSLKVVLVVLLADLILLAAANLLLSDEVEQREAQVGQLRAQLGQLRHQNTEVRRQIAEYPQLSKRYEDAIAKGVMAGLNRLQLVNNAEALATRHHLSDLHFKVEGETAVAATAAAPTGRSSAPPPKAKFVPEATIVTFDSGALLDSHAMDFWDDVLNGLPTHYRVVEASLERIHDIDGKVLASVRAGQPASPVKMKIAFRAVTLHPASQEAP